MSHYADVHHAYECPIRRDGGHFGTFGLSARHEPAIGAIPDVYRKPRRGQWWTGLGLEFGQTPRHYWGPVVMSTYRPWEGVCRFASQANQRRWW